MPKIRLKVEIKNDETIKNTEVQAIIQDDVIKYKEDENTLVIFSYKNQTLTRENKKLKMNFTFRLNKKTEGEIYFKDLDKMIKVEIDTKSIQKKENNLTIEYEIEKNKFTYKIEELI